RRLEVLHEHHRGGRPDAAEHFLTARGRLDVTQIEDVGVHTLAAQGAAAADEQEPARVLGRGRECALATVVLVEADDARGQPAQDQPEKARKDEEANDDAEALPRTRRGQPGNRDAARDATPLVRSPGRYRRSVRTVAAQAVPAQFPGAVVPP